MSPRQNFWRRRIRSVGVAVKGFLILLRTEDSIQIQFAIAVFVTVLGFIVKLSPVEWMIQLLAVALVMSIEGLNTAVEKMADFIHPQHHEKIGFIKDIAAGAVVIAAVIASVIGWLIYWPKFQSLF